MKRAVAASELRLALIKTHPDLANKTQRAAGLDRLSDAEYQAFERVNNAYRSKFGFPYIVCVRRHTRDSILRDFERRLPNDAKDEAQKSVEEIYRIAALRLDQVVASVAAGLFALGKYGTETAAHPEMPLAAPAE